MKQFYQVAIGNYESNTLEIKNYKKLDDAKTAFINLCKKYDKQLAFSHYYNTNPVRVGAVYQAYDPEWDDYLEINLVKAKFTD